MQCRRAWAPATILLSHADSLHCNNIFVWGYTFGRVHGTDRSKGKGRKMKFRTLIAAAASISLMTTPAVAAAGDAAAAAAEIAPATESVGSDGQQIYGASIILQFAILVALAAAIYFGAKALDGDDEPASP